MWWREAKVGNAFCVLVTITSSDGIVLGLQFVQRDADLMWKIIPHKYTVCRRKSCAGYTGCFWNRWPWVTYSLFGPKRRHLIQTRVLWSFVFAVWPLWVSEYEKSSAIFSSKRRTLRVPVVKFYIHGSVHRDSILIRSNKMQQYAGVYLLQNYSTCFGCISHPSSGVHHTVTAEWWVR